MSAGCCMGAGLLAVRSTKVNVFCADVPPVIPESTTPRVRATEEPLAQNPAPPSVEMGPFVKPTGWPIGAVPEKNDALKASATAGGPAVTSTRKPPALLVADEGTLLE